MDADIVDYSLLAGVSVALATGLAGLVARPGDMWLFLVHGGVGITLVGFLSLKLWRVRARIRAGVRARSGRVAVSILLTALAVAALATGIAWVFGATLPGAFTLLFVHGVLGVVTTVVLVGHLRDRLRLPSRATLRDRRQTLSWVGMVTLGAAAYRASDALGTARRDTGSREQGSDGGNEFPVTAWVADDPDPLDPASYRLAVTGRVDTPLELPVEAVDAGDAERALLDCTSGWYTVQDWRGTRVGDLLDAADGPTEDATHVRFVSVTGYRWTLPLEEARDALLATHVGGERLSHGHGAPVRLVAPGRRGFQWVKWVTRVEVRAGPDPAQWVVTLVSGFD